MADRRKELQNYNYRKDLKDSGRNNNNKASEYLGQRNRWTEVGAIIYILHPISNTWSNISGKRIVLPQSQLKTFLCILFYWLYSKSLVWLFHQSLSWLTIRSAYCLFSTSNLYFNSFFFFSFFYFNSFFLWNSFFFVKFIFFVKMHAWPPWPFHITFQLSC